jgi:cytochrome c553
VTRRRDRTGPLRRALLWVGCLAAAAAQAQPATTDYAARYAAVCAACHGPAGLSTLAETPSLAGQHSFYAITQLFLFRAGRRQDPAMSAIAKDMTDDDLRGFSDWIAKLPALPGTALAGDPVRLAQGQALVARHRCASCHGANFSGEGQVPRLAGQREEYLARTLREFRAGTRTGYTQAMNEALAGIAPQELDDLAHYLARIPAGP